MAFTCDTVNYDETKIPAYRLPEILTCFNGDRVTSPAMWVNRRRGELLGKFKQLMYGEEPPRPDAVHSRLLSEKTDALAGQAVRREYELEFAMNSGAVRRVTVLVYLPADKVRQRIKVPAFLGLNFKGNHATTDEDGVIETGLNSPSGVESRGGQVGRWQFPEVLSRGYASITACYHDFFQDCLNGWDDSIYALFFTPDRMDEARKSFSAIGAWAWGLSRMLDLAESIPEIDKNRIAVHGHSRLGKTALWAGSLDRRFRMVCSNDSGCGGAALSRRLYGETLELMMTNEIGLYWFVPELRRYASTPEKLPIDQHELLALIAPRPLAVHSATLDQWADPKGEFLSALQAGEVYRLFGGKGLGVDEQPAPDTPVSSDVSYLLRTGKHDQDAADWAHYLDLADRWL